MKLAPPQEMQLVGDELAIRWQDGREDFIKHEALRAASPSALNKGEYDIFGNKYGGDSRTSFPGVRLKGWRYVGNYAVQLEFTDGHNSGLYKWSLLRELGQAHNQA